jgi:hypothetical protein
VESNIYLEVVSLHIANPFRLKWLAPLRFKPVENRGDFLDGQNK